jgi:hypothetical protein
MQVVAIASLRLDSERDDVGLTRGRRQHPALGGRYKDGHRFAEAVPHVSQLITTRLESCGG